MSNSLKTANAYAWNLALTLMVTVVVYQAGNGQYGAAPTHDYDGEASTIIHEFDPYR